MLSKISFITSLAVAVLLIPMQSQAATSKGRVCRGSLSGLQLIEVKRAVQAKLTSQGISFASVKVEVKNVVRPTDTYSVDFDSDIALSEGTTPSASFTGAFTAPTTCTITANLRIIVRYTNGQKKTSVNPVTFFGVLLPKRKSVLDD